MTPYLWAWIAVVTAVPLGLLALYRASRGLDWPRTKLAVAVLLAVWLLLPAPVPGFDGHYAPAFVVFLFEGLFQQAGNPRPAGLILAAGTVLALAAFLITGVARRRRSG